jgi:chromosomal replication initiation ATPase DnaA
MKEFVHDIKSFDELINELDLKSKFSNEIEIKIQKLINFLQPSTNSYGSRLKIANYIQIIAKNLNMKVNLILINKGHCFWFIKI